MKQYFLGLANIWSPPHEQEHKRNLIVSTGLIHSDDTKTLPCRFISGINCYMLDTKHKNEKMLIVGDYETMTVYI